MKNTAELPQGSLAHTSKLLASEVKIHVVKYNNKKIIEANPNKIETALKAIDSKHVTWINVSGIHKTEVIQKIGTALDIHPLVQEDIMYSRQRPKIEEHEKHLFIVLKLLYYSSEKELISEQLSILLGKYYIITFQETDSDLFEKLIERIRAEKGKIRKSKPDYLAYSILDLVVDNYLVVSDKFGEDSEIIETDLLKQKEEKTMEKIFKVKKNLSLLRKAVLPLRDIISKLEKYELNLISGSTKIYLRDVHDHLIEIMDTTETLRDRNSSMADIHLSNISNKMNEVMKVLTIIATIFIPLTFVTGLYGMNFKYMPELKWFYGYPTVLIIMTIIALGMLYYFKKKKWL